MEKFKPYAFLFLAGILYALGYPSRISDSLIITPMIAIGILFYYLLKDQSFKERAIKLLCFNLSFNLVGFYWIADTLVEFGQLPYPLALFLNALFALIITPHYWVAIIVIQFFQKQISKLQEEHLGLFSLTLSIFLTLCEVLVPQQFNVFLGQPLVALNQYLGFAHIGGLPIYSFFSYLFVFESLNLIIKKDFSKFNYATIIIFIIINPFFTPDRNQENIIESRVRLVQANISNFLKIDSEKGSYASVGQVINQYFSMSLKKSSFPRALDLIIWPETAYPFAIKVDREKIRKTTLPTIVQEITSETKAELFFGGYDTQRDLANSSYYKTEHNTGFHVEDSGELVATYNKRILIPFGETLPFGPLNKFLSGLISNISFFKEGEVFTEFKLQNGSRFISSICYELLKPDFIREYLNSISQRPHFMINLTNDSWYGKTMEPEQHLFLAKWRALEFNLPIVRSTNTGISSVIFADGTESRRLGVYERGNLDLKLSFGVNSPTLYQRFGFAILFPLWFLYFIFHGLRIRLKNE